MPLFEKEGLREGLLMRPKRKSVTVEEVTNGFIVSTNNSENFSDKRAIAKTKKDANKMASKFLGSKT